jgi:hypothetical protein
MEFKDADKLLDPAPLPLEMGIHRLPSGVLCVAARTHMLNCTGRMFEWWFRFAPDDQQYVWWHPGDHVSSKWWETSPDTHIGSTHDAVERIGGDEALHLFIAFHDPTETFSANAYTTAVEQGNISAAICARMGTGDEPLRDEHGRPRNGRMTHVARDTDYGCVLRSRFWLGEGLGVSPEQLHTMIPDHVGLGLMKHAYSEFFYLSRFLPSLYIAEQREHEHVPAPW